MSKKIRVFLDSNVILSGLISDKGAPRVILDLLSLELPFLAGVTGQYNIIEIERNIEKKIPRIMTVYKEYFPVMHLEIVPLPSAAEVKRFAGSTSAKDIPVIVSAAKGEADFLVTGDKKDFDKLRIRNKYLFKILNPSEFLDVILPRILKGTD